MKIKFECEDCKKSETIEYIGMSKEEVVEFGKIYDGSSDMYIISPRNDPNSLIGRCANCAGQVNCEVVN